MASTKENIAWPYAQDRTSAANQYLAEKWSKYHRDRIYRPPMTKYVTVGDRVEEIKEVIVHEFSMGDVEDPDLYAAQPLCEWEQSDQGQWIMKHACDTPTWYRIADPISMGYKYQIRARLMGSALTEWLLRNGR